MGECVLYHGLRRENTYLIWDAENVLFILNVFLSVPNWVSVLRNEQIFHLSDCARIPIRSDEICQIQLIPWFIPPVRCSKCSVCIEYCTKQCLNATYVVSAEFHARGPTASLTHEDVNSGLFGLKMNPFWLWKSGKRTMITHVAGPCGFSTENLITKRRGACEMWEWVFAALYISGN